MEDAYEIFAAKAKEREEFWKGKIVECDLYPFVVGYTTPFAARIEGIRFNNRGGFTEYTLVEFGTGRKREIRGGDIFRLKEIKDVASYVPYNGFGFMDEMSKFKRPPMTLDEIVEENMKLINEGF